jgi:hypothetical protein
LKKIINEIEVPIYKTEIKKIVVGTKKVKKNIYVASDGTEFDSLKDCKIYDKHEYSNQMKSIPYFNSYGLKYDDYTYLPSFCEGRNWYYFKSYEEFESFALHEIYKETQIDNILNKAKTFNFPDWINFVEDDSGDYGPYYEIYSFKEEEQRFLNLKKALFEIKKLI